MFEFTAQNSKFWLMSFPVGVHVNARVHIFELPVSVKPLASDPAGGVGMTATAAPRQTLGTGGKSRGGRKNTRVDLNAAGVP